MMPRAFSGAIGSRSRTVAARRLVADLLGRLVRQLGLVAGGLQVLLHVGLQVVRARPEDRLHVVADQQHRPPPEGLELVLVRLVDVLDADAQPGDAGVQVGDVALAAEGEHQLLGEPVGGILDASPGSASASSRPGV